MKHLRRARVAALIAVPVVAVAAGFALRSFDQAATASTKAALLRVLDTPGQMGEAGEVSLTKVERLLADAVHVPDGAIQQAWLRTAAKQAKRIKSGFPKGFYRPWRGDGGRARLRTTKTQAATALAAARPLGPQPQASNGCQAPCFTFGLVSGRVSAIAFDPVRPTWRTSRRTAAASGRRRIAARPTTTWEVTTDGKS